MDERRSVTLCDTGLPLMQNSFHSLFRQQTFWFLKQLGDLLLLIILANSHNSHRGQRLLADRHADLWEPPHHGAFSTSNYPEFLPENFLCGGVSEMRPAFIVCFTILAKEVQVKSLMLFFFA